MCIIERMEKNDMWKSQHLRWWIKPGRSFKSFMWQGYHRSQACSGSSCDIWRKTPHVDWKYPGRGLYYSGCKDQFVNESFARISDYSIQELTGKDFRELVAPEDLDMVVDLYSRGKLEKMFQQNMNSICCERTVQELSSTWTSVLSIIRGESRV